MANLINNITTKIHPEKRLEPIPRLNLSTYSDKADNSLNFKSIILISLWSGLVTGMIDVLIQLFRKFGLHQIIGLSLDLIWMAPLTDTMIFLVVGLLFTPYSRRFARVNNIKVLVFLLTFLSAFSVVLYLPVEWYARDILTLGLAVFCAQAISQFKNKFISLVHKTALPIAGLIILAGFGLHISTGITERKALSNLPAADPGLPNILLIVMDTVRAENLSLYGYERDTTPTLQELAKEGVVFQNAFSTAPWTLPSHASLFTGRWVYELSLAWDTPLDDTYPTLAEVLKTFGYQTAGFVGNSYNVTYEFNLNRGFTHFEDFDMSVGQIFISSSIGRGIGCWRLMGPGCNFREIIGSYQDLGRKNDQKVNKEAMAWVVNNRNKPYFIFINYFDAHSPYLPPEPFDTIFDPKRPQFSKVFRTGMVWEGTPDETQREETAYDESIRSVDNDIKSLLEQLKSQGLLQNTLIIITSDHGEEFREHGVMGHGDSLYRQSVQVPLIMIFPEQIPAGVVIPEPVSLRNIPATVLDLIGRSEDSPFTGNSLMQYLNSSDDLWDTLDMFILNEVTHADWRPSSYPSSKGDLKSIAMDGFRYILNGDGSEELYDFNHDPEETKDLVHSPKGQAALLEFRFLIKNILLQSSSK